MQAPQIGISDAICFLGSSNEAMKSFLSLSETHSKKEKKKSRDEPEVIMQAPKFFDS